MQVRGRLSAGYADFGGRAWLNTAHQGALPLAAAEAAGHALGWKTDPRALTPQRFEDVPQRVRAALAKLVNVAPEEIILANSASYGLHLIASAYPWVPGDEVLVMAGDFPSDVLPWLTLDRLGVRVRSVRPRRRVVTADELAAAITPDTRLFCTPWVHSFSGYVADLDALGDVCRRHGVFMVVNASQAIGARPFDAAAMPVDALTCAGFKWLCGPYGTGFSWLRPALRQRLHRVQAYWLSQFSQADLTHDELPLELPASRPARELDIFGTANFNNYVPWAVAIEHLIDTGVDRIRAHDQALVDHLVNGLREAGAAYHGPAEPAARSTLVFFGHPDPAGNPALHAALTAAGVDVALRAGALRASPHLYNGVGDIDRLLDAVRDFTRSYPAPR